MVDRGYLMVKNFAASLSVAVLASALSLAVTNQAAMAKGKKIAYRGGSHNYFVPPPPPYVPSIQPELGRMYGGAEVEADSDIPSVQTPETRWSKYIYVRNGYAVQSNSGSKYVTNWNNKG
ncbi:MAG TPA: hypothetical protein V6C97_36440 [Oculatellaceae cyanobacterium]